jgi:hypothetical protein
MELSDIRLVGAFSIPATIPRASGLRVVFDIAIRPNAKSVTHKLNFQPLGKF